jgi:hypothetical protein
MTLMVETSSGVYLRPIRPATLLPEGMPVGDAAEHATKSAAAYWGLPDFAFHSSQQFSGHASREIGDAILVVGNTAASVQVKARQAPSADENRERLWLDKKINQAARQAVGTIRRVKSTPQTILVNQRGHEVAIKGSDKSWQAIIVLDHPGVHDYMPPHGGPVVLLRRDWEFLFEQLKSTYAVLEYLPRVSSTEPVMLGQEPLRYYEFAAADAATRPSPLDPRLATINHTASSTPLLPQAPAGHGEYQHHLLLRSILEDIATIRPKADGMTYADVLDVLACLDATPVGDRAQLGRTLLGWFAELAKHPPDADLTWRSRGIILPDRPYLLFAAANRHGPLVMEGFSMYVSLRHQQHLDLLPERSKMMTVGVLLTPRLDGQRRWDTTMAAAWGEERFDDEVRGAAEELWGRLGEHVVKSTTEIDA